MLMIAANTELFVQIGSTDVFCLDSAAGLWLISGHMCRLKCLSDSLPSNNSNVLKFTEIRIPST